jgi:hypothetical protein
MTSRGFGTEAAKRTPLGRHVTPVSKAIDAIERGVERRSRRVVTPRWVEPLLHTRMVAQRVTERAISPRKVAQILEIARREDAPLTTPQEQEPSRSS